VRFRPVRNCVSRTSQSLVSNFGAVGNRCAPTKEPWARPEYRTLIRARQPSFCTNSCAGTRTFPPIVPALLGRGQLIFKVDSGRPRLQSSPSSAQRHSGLPPKPASASATMGAQPVSPRSSPRSGESGRRAKKALLMPAHPHWARLLGGIKALVGIHLCPARLASPATCHPPQIDGLQPRPSTCCNRPGFRSGAPQSGNVRFFMQHMPQALRTHASQCVLNV